jgi:hypothetical protein
MASGDSRLKPEAQNHAALEGKKMKTRAILSSVETFKVETELGAIYIVPNGLKRAQVNALISLAIALRYKRRPSWSAPMLPTGI